MRGPWRPVVALVALVALVAGAACSGGTVEVALGAGPGDGYAYRYDVSTVVVRSVDGGPEEVRRTTSSLLVDQRIVAVGDDGRLQAVVVLSRDGGPAQQAEVQLDRAGSLAAIEALDGVPAAELGLAGLDPVLLAEASAPPGPLRPGQTWRIDTDPADGATVTGSGRLDRLDAGGGRRTAVATTDLAASIRSMVDVGSSAASVVAEQRTRGTTAYDLDDGAVRWAEVLTTGTATVTIEPPPGVEGEPAVAELRYEVAVATQRR